MKYLLDTNVISSLMRRDAKVEQRYRLAGKGQSGMSSVTVQELHYGAHQSGRTAFYLATIADVAIDVVTLDATDGRHAGELRAMLAKAGTPIGPYDVLIAGQAMARDLILVTHNTREFSRVEGLQVEDWEA